MSGRREEGTARRRPAAGRLTGMSPLAPAPPAARRPPRGVGRPSAATVGGRRLRDPLGEYGPDGKPTAAALRAAGDPPQGAPLTDAAFDRLVTEFAVELVDGRLSYLPMPRDLHGLICNHLFRRLDRLLTTAHPGAVLQTRNVRVRVPGRTREPDLVVLLDGDDPRRGPEVWTGADLCVEVVSPDDPDRDHDAKRAEYAAAGVPEYWIVDPRDRTAADDRGRSVRVLSLENGTYAEAVYGDGKDTISPLLPGLTFGVTACLAGA